MLWFKRGEAVEKRRGGGCCLRADYGMESRILVVCSASGRPPDFIKGQIGGFVLHKLYHQCSDFC